ncbi:MAG: YggW family oxidoreductase, partial [Comamonadaceae bacterium PBBC2]
MNPLDPVHAMRPGVLQLNALPPLSLYVHLPWCLKKCPYCDFNSHEFRSGDDAASMQDTYINALFADLEASLPLIWGRSIQTVFLGGGTPSLFDPEAIDRLVGGIRARVRLAPDAEITMKAFRQAGITRLSIGVQSFDNAHLKALGRVHDRDQALAAVTEAAQVFDTFNLDLMYALPGQTLDGLTQDIQTALAFEPPHISIYHLTIEPNTVF